MSFSDDLLRFRRKTLEKYRTVKRLSAFDLFSAIVLETPVDKGVLRNNWFAAMGAGSTETTDSEDRSGNSTIQRIKQVLDGTDLSIDIFLTNNLPYAPVVEFGGYPNPPEGGKGLTSGGFSRKAPEGMVRINTLRWDQIVKNNVRLVNRGS